MKRWLRLVIAAVVIAALVVVLILVRARGDGQSETETPVVDTGDRVEILDVPRETIEEIDIVRGDDTMKILSLGDGAFIPDYRYDVSWIAARVDRIVGSVTSLNSTRVIAENPESFDDYGLSSPSVLVTASLDDGSSVGVEIGNLVPGGAGYYVRRPGEDVVYSVASVWITPFLYSLDDLRDKTLPTISPETVQEVTIRNLEGRTIEVVKKDVSGDPELALSPLVVVQPYARTYGVATNWLDEVVKAVPGIVIRRYVDDDPRNLAQYGLAQPEATFRIRDEQSVLDVLIGSTTEGGRFARMADGGSVFVLSGTDDIITSRPYDTISAFAYIVNIDLVERIQVDTAGTTYVLRIERQPSPDPDEDPIETFYFQDEEMDEELFRDLYQWVIGLLLDREADRTPTAAPELTVRFTLNNGDPDVRIDYLPYDANYDAVMRDGYAEFLITKTKIGRLQAVLADPESARN